MRDEKLWVKTCIRGTLSEVEIHFLGDTVTLREDAFHRGIRRFVTQKIELDAPAMRALINRWMEMEEDV